MSFLSGICCSSSSIFNLTPIPIPRPSVESVALQKKIDKCSRHILRLQRSLNYRRTDKSTVRMLIDEFKKRETELHKQVECLKSAGLWEENAAEKDKKLPWGNLYRAQMPCSIGRKPHAGILELQQAGIVRIFVLSEASECNSATGTDLLKLYAENGIKVVHFPVKDFGAWKQADFNEKAHQLYHHLLQGENVAFHCRGGIGRTGTLIAAVVSKALKVDGETAIGYVRKHGHPRSVETIEQKVLVKSFSEKYTS